MLRKLFYSFSNPYKILKVSPDATLQEIKLAYYKLAQQYHPDKNKSADASKLFSQINQAYEQLQDENKRKEFQDEAEEDDFDEEFAKKNKSKKKPSKKYKYQKYEDYESIFDEFDQFFKMKHGKRKQYHQKTKGNDIKLNLHLSFKEALFGIQKIVTYSKTSICTSCSGSGAQTKGDIQQCYTCGGTGWLSYSDRGSSMDVKCTNCDGWGKVIRDQCRKCQGDRIFTHIVDKKIDMPRNVQDGNVIRLQEAGHASKTGGQSGDLLIDVSVENDQQLKREGNNIISDLNLSVSELFLGCVKQINTIWGDLDITIPALQQPKSRIPIPQYGIQYGDAKWKKGDHILIVRLNIPQSLDEQTKTIYEEINKTL